MHAGRLTGQARENRLRSRPEDQPLCVPQVDLRVDVAPQRPQRVRLDLPYAGGSMLGTAAGAELWAEFAQRPGNQQRRSDARAIRDERRGNRRG